MFSRKAKFGYALWWVLAPMIVAAGAQIIGGLPFTLTNGTVADATQVMADFNQIVNNTNANAAKNGVNADITALSALSTPITPAQGGTSVFIASAAGGGSANAQTVTATIPSTFALTANYQVVFSPGSTNTGATTLNVAATGVKNVLKTAFSGLVALTGGEIRSGVSNAVIYDGTQYVLPVWPTIGVLTGLASAATTDLGTVASHHVNITGTTTITSFGTSASTDYPFYFIRSGSGALVIQAGATIGLPFAVTSLVLNAGDTAVASYLITNSWAVTTVSRNAVGSGAPTVQRFTTGTSLTYTPTPGTPRARVRMVAGGGGGGAQATNAGTTGTTTTFGSWTVIGGTGGPSGTAITIGGAGGTGGATGTGSVIWRQDGSRGDGSSTSGTFATGHGGGTALGGTAPVFPNGPAGTPPVNSGGGGSGGAAGPSGGGGGGGEYVEFWVTNPGATVYTVGPGGAGGAAGTIAGATGAAGIIIIEEFYW